MTDVPPPDTSVARTATEYAAAIAGELPTGPAWSRDPDGGLMEWVAGCSGVWGDVSARAADFLVVESDPRSTLELLGDWERAFGLPDPCVKRILTIPERHLALVNKLTTQGGQSIAYFEGVAAALGYAISIYEYRPYTGGLSVCGETRPDGGLSFTYTRCGAMRSGEDPICRIKQTGNGYWVYQLGAPNLRFFWVVTILNTRLTWLRAGSGVCGQDPMCEFAQALDLQCEIQRWAPAHTVVIFDYSQVDYAVSASATLDFTVSADSGLLPLL